MLTFSISLLSFLGWSLNSSLIISVSNKFVPIAPSTALCFFLLSGSLLLRCYRENKLSHLLVSVSASLTLSASLIIFIGFFQRHYRELEHLGFTVPSENGTFPLGYMSPLTAITFVAATLGFLLQIKGTGGKRNFESTASSLGISVIVVGFVVLLGYFHGTPLLYGGTTIPMALPTAVAFIFLGLGLVASTGPRAFPIPLFSGNSIRVRLLRTFLPLVVAFVLLSDILDSLVLRWTANPALTSTLFALISAILIGIIVSRLATSLGDDIEIAHNRIIAAERALIKSQERWQFTFDSMQDAVWLLDKDNRIKNCNKATAAIFGKNSDDILGKPCWEVVHGTGQALPGCPVITMKRTLSREAIEIKLNDRWFSVTADPILDDAREIVGAVHVVSDITKRKEMEHELAAALERLSVTLRSIGDGVITTDMEGRITMLNQVAEELTGWSLNDALERPLSEVFHIINQRTREICENPAEKVLKSGCIVGLANHTALICRDGSERIIADSGAPIREKDGGIIGVVLVFRDITEKEKMEKALQNTQKLEAIGALAAGIAHDFNNLLGGIFGYLDLARDQAERGDCAGAANALIKGISVFERARHLTRQLLTFSTGGTPIRLPLPIPEQVQKTVAFALSGSNITPVFTIEPRVWHCDIDENQIAQVFDNIVINARQAMPLGGRIEISIVNVAAGDAPFPLQQTDCVRVSLRDYGCGISKDHLPRIFDPFFTTKQQGNGLGLAICYSIVHKHDGHIDVESEPGKGTTFHIYLPSSVSSACAGESESVAAHQGVGRILVMDDETFLLDILRVRLVDMGYDCITAEDGEVALKLAREAIEGGAPFCAAILDLTIPGGRGGNDIIGELLELDPSLKVIASSGYSDDPVMSRPADFGFCGCLAKPYRTSDLAMVMHSLRI